MSLSAFNRETKVKELESRTFDLLVIGGGITGAGIALDAASRGIDTLLVEMQDFAGGTSSRSTKLIHGGLRYLQQLDVRLVREVGLERAVLYKNAPHLVIPEKMLLPLRENGKHSKTATSLGLWIYDLLAGVEKSERRKMLNTDDTLKQEPLLLKEGLKGSGLYWEYRTDDARLTMEVIKTAVEKGATCFNYMKVFGFNYENGKVSEARIHDAIANRNFEVKFKEVINAAGPWVDKVREVDRSLAGKKLHHTKGVHVVVPWESLPLKEAVYYDLDDGRMSFAIPRDRITYIGTTDTNFFSDLVNPPVMKQDVEYILNGANKMFPSVNLQLGDVVSTWSGIRPLIHQEGKSPSELSRKDEIFKSKTGLISIAGGKLTGYRKMAERSVNLVMKRLKKQKVKPWKPSSTREITLSGGNFKDRKEVNYYIDQLVGKFGSQLNQEGIIRELVNRYGDKTEHLLEKASQRNDVETMYDKIILSQIDYGLEHEAIFTPADFLIRRTGMMYFERERSLEVLPLVTEYLSKKLNWTTEAKDKHKTEFMRLHHQNLDFE